MKNKYEETLKSIIKKYEMQCNGIIDSKYINSLLVKIFQMKCANKRIALWGAGRNNSVTSHASVILTRYISQLQGMVCLIDSAKEVQGKDFLGFPVISPEMAADEELDLVIVASRASAKSIRTSIEHFLPECEVLDIYEELSKQGVNLFYNFYEEKSYYSQLYDLRTQYEKENSSIQKKKLLKELIATYLFIRDFQYAFYFIEQYENAGYDENGNMQAMSEEIRQLLYEVKEKNKNREGDITFFFVDSVRAMDVIGQTDNGTEYYFIEPYLKNARVYTNAYSTGPTTYESLIGIMTQQYSFKKDVYADNFMFDIDEVPFLKEANKKDMDIHFYVSEEYKIMNLDERISFHNHIHMTEKLWNLACVKAVSSKPVLSFAYIVWELHFPLLCGYLTNKPVVNGFYEVGLKDMSGYIEQQFQDCFRYTDKEFLYYWDIIKDNGYSVFFSDHSQVVYDKQHVWPFYKYYNDPEKQTHCMLALQGPGIAEGTCDKYISMLQFNSIVLKYVFNKNIEIAENEIVHYQYYNIHNPELRRLAKDKGYTDYIDGMNCYASRKYVYMINIHGKQEVFCRDNLDSNIADTKEGKNFIEEVRKQFDEKFPDFLLERLQ